MHMNIFNVPMYVSSGHSDYVESVAFSPDGNTIASGSYDKTIKLWNPQTGDLIRTLDGNCCVLYNVASFETTSNGILTVFSFLVLQPFFGRESAPAQ